MTGPPETEVAVTPHHGDHRHHTATAQPPGNQPVITDQNSAARQQVTQAQRRRAAAWRCAPLLCGCTDPWVTRHRNHDEPQPDPSDRDLDGWVAAADHLIAAGLNPLVPIGTARALWRRSPEGRRLIAQIHTTGRP
jgi:hypothetical protein